MTKEFNDFFKEQISSYNKEIALYEKLLENVAHLSSLLKGDDSNSSSVF